MAMALTAQVSVAAGPGAQPGIVHAHNAYCYRCPFGLTYPDCEVKCAQDMEELIRTTTTGRIAGFIAEPIQGVGGFITPPKEYFPIVEKIVRNHGGVFISDEVQTGWGRTGGKWFGIEQWGVYAGHHHQRQGHGERRPDRAHCGRSRRWPMRVKGVHDLDIRRQSGDGDRGQSGDRLHRREQPAGRTARRPATICAGDSRN